MGEGFAAQQVKDLKNNSRKKGRKKYFDRTRKLDIIKRKNINFKKEGKLSNEMILEIKSKIATQSHKEKIKNYMLLIISIFITFTVFKILYNTFKDAF